MPSHTLEVCPHKMLAHLFIVQNKSHVRVQGILPILVKFTETFEGLNCLSVYVCLNQKEKKNYNMQIPLK